MAAVLRAKRSLGDTIDQRLNRFIGDLELRVPGALTGVPADAAEARLATATVEEIKAWESRVAAMTPAEMTKALNSN